MNLEQVDPQIAELIPTLEARRQGDDARINRFGKNHVSKAVMEAGPVRV